MLRNVIEIVYGIICISMIILVLMQEGKSGGLGSLGGMTETYWSKNKSRSLEGNLKKATYVLGFLFIVLSLVLNMKW